MPRLEQPVRDGSPAMKCNMPALPVTSWRGGSLEDELCPDEVEGWTLQDASAAVLAHLGDTL
jgi:hypothetical protein